MQERTACAGDVERLRRGVHGHGDRCYLWRDGRHRQEPMTGIRELAVNLIRHDYQVVLERDAPDRTQLARPPHVPSGVMWVAHDDHPRTTSDAPEVLLIQAPPQPIV